MSSPDICRRDLPPRAAHPFRIACAALLLLAVAGCTVRPLYGDVTASTGTGRAASAQSLASVAIGPVEDRVGQEVRNHLIFLLGGGAGQPANPEYTLNLRASARKASAAAIQVGTTDLEPTSAVVTVRASYTLVDAQGTVVSAGTRSAQAAYDVSRQSFAALRAERDAQNRAARELAEQLRAAIAQDMERPASTTAPAVITTTRDIEDFPEEDANGALLQ